MRFRSRLPDAHPCPVCGRSGATPGEQHDERTTARVTLGERIAEMELRLTEAAELTLPMRSVS